VLAEQAVGECGAEDPGEPIARGSSLDHRTSVVHAARRVQTIGGSALLRCVGEALRAVRLRGQRGVDRQRYRAQ
jgi:hypothetical protein